MDELQKHYKNKKGDIMEKREELLNGLYYCRSKIDTIANLYEQEIEVESNFRTAYKTVDMKDKKTIFNVAKWAVFIGLMIYYLSVTFARSGMAVFILNLLAIVFLFITKNKGGTLRKVAFVIMAYCIISFIYQMIKYNLVGPFFIFFVVPIIVLLVVALIIYNIIMKKKNEDVAINNSYYYNQYDELELQIQNTKQELMSNTSSWYPKDYYNAYAVEWFVNAVENYQCNTMQECIQQFKISEFQNQMLQEQRELKEEMEANMQQVNQSLDSIKRHVRFANIMNMMNFATQLSTQRKIDYQNGLIQSQNNLINSQNQAINLKTQAINRNTQEVESLRSTIGSKF